MDDHPRPVGQRAARAGEPERARPLHADPAQVAHAAVIEPRGEPHRAGFAGHQRRDHRPDPILVHRLHAPRQVLLADREVVERAGRLVGDDHRVAHLRSGGDPRGRMALELDRVLVRSGRRGRSRRRARTGATSTRTPAGTRGPPRGTRARAPRGPAPCPARRACRYRASGGTERCTSRSPATRSTRAGSDGRAARQTGTGVASRTSFTIVFGSTPA